MTVQMTPIAVPYAVDGRGRTQEADPQSHLRDLIGGVLFTSPGERVMRPTFGSGALRLLFAPNSDQLAATTKMMVTSALTQTLGDLIQVSEVTIDNTDSTFTITVTYLVRSTNETADATFESIL
jgi:uncharacterized protein